MSIKVYSTPTCPYCFMLKDWLKERKLEFVDIDVSRDRKAAVEMVTKSGQTGVPQAEVNGRMIVGFDPKAIEAVLKQPARA
jgi:glutaredoxin 3